MITSYFLSMIKLLGTSFFIWSLPFAVIVVNILEEEEVLQLNTLFAFLIGLIINFIWEIIHLYLKKKEYHKNLL